MRDIDIRWALEIQRKIRNLNPISTPRYYDLKSLIKLYPEKFITKFIARGMLVDSANILKEAEAFVRTVKPFIEQFESENVYNTD